MSMTYNTGGGRMCISTCQGLIGQIRGCVGKSQKAQAKTKLQLLRQEG